MYRRKVTNFVCTPNDPLVATKYGNVLGYRADDVNIFRGISYAKAKRFQMPQEPDAWEGTKEALRYGPGCPEMTFSMHGLEDRDHLREPGRIWAVSEDCQNLNIWTKHLDPNAKRPVMVYLHGGGYTGGSATHLYTYDGYEMADCYDVVLVTINHRLNMLGFMDLSAFGGKYEFSANAGMADIVAALEWVRDNIANFGGDPNNVTIYGQSGGGGKVSTLMQMPAADGLYHRAIIQSGIMGGFGGRRGPTCTPAQLAQRTVEILGLNQDTIEQISELEYETVLDAVNQASVELTGRPGGSWGPVTDGKYYVGPALEVGFSTETKDIPVMIGSCLAEFGRGMPLGDKRTWTDEQRMEVLTRQFGDNAGEVKALFQEAYPQMDWSYAGMTDLTFRPATVKYIEKRCELGSAPIFNYVFTFESPMMGGQLPGHSGELNFMFHNAAYIEVACKPGVTDRLQDEMAGAWAQFAYTGSPNGVNLPTWEAYTLEGCACMNYGDITVLRHGHDKALLEKLQELAAK